MSELTLDVARKILDAALAKGIEKKLKPLVVTVLDARGCVKISAAQDGTARAALHVARVLAMSLDTTRSKIHPSPIAKEPLHG